MSESSDRKEDNKSNEWRTKLQLSPSNNWFRWEDSIIQSLMADFGSAFSDAIINEKESSDLLDVDKIKSKYVPVSTSLGHRGERLSSRCDRRSAKPSVSSCRNSGRPGLSAQQGPRIWKTFRDNDS